MLSSWSSHFCHPYTTICSLGHLTWLILQAPLPLISFLSTTMASPVSILLQPSLMAMSWTLLTPKTAKYLLITLLLLLSSRNFQTQNPKVPRSFYFPSFVHFFSDQIKVHCPCLQSLALTFYPIVLSMRST